MGFCQRMKPDAVCCSSFKCLQLVEATALKISINNVADFLALCVPPAVKLFTLEFFPHLVRRQ